MTTVTNPTWISMKTASAFPSAGSGAFLKPRTEYPRLARCLPSGHHHLAEIPVYWVEDRSGHALSADRSEGEVRALAAEDA